MLNGQVFACENNIKAAMALLDDVLDVSRDNNYVWTKAFLAGMKLQAAIDTLHENDY